MPPRLSGFFGFIFMAIGMHLSGTWRRYAAALIALLILCAAIGITAVKPAAGFPIGFAKVPAGASLGSVAAEFSADGLIDHPFLFKLIVKALGREDRIAAGTYLFDRPIGTAAAAWRIAYGETGVEPVRVTFPEGSASFDMARILSAAMPAFDAKAFESLAKTREGYLFPDTYQITPDEAPADILKTLEDTFAARTAPLAGDIESSAHTEDQIVSMAAIVEREAATPEDRRIVAGILWHRIRIGMALQVDAPFAYLAEDWSHRPTATDLDLDSSFNTYENRGLPPPIANPGYDAIDATLHPTDTPYLYYLTGSDGKMHYATTFEEHKANRLKYL